MLWQSSQSRQAFLQGIVGEYICCICLGVHVSKRKFTCQVCAASKKKSLAGLDSNTADGVSAIQSLENVAESLRNFGMLNP